MVKLFKNLLKTYSILLFIAIVAGIFVSAFKLKANIALYIAATLFILIMLGISKLIKNNISLIIVSLFALLVMLYIIFTIKNVQISDFELFYNAGLDIKYGRRDYLAFDKFFFWPFQVGYSSYIALLLNIWENEMIIKLSNVFWAMFASFSIYGLTLETTKNFKMANLAFVIHLFFPARLVMLPVITNQFLASALIYFALYLWLKLDTNNFLNILLIAFILALANAARSIAIVSLGAICLFGLLNAIKLKSYNQEISKILKLCLCYVIIFTCISSSFAWTGLSPRGLKNDALLWKFATGTNYEYNGAYNPALYQKIYGDEGMTEEEREYLTKQAIKDNLSQTDKMLVLPYKKIESHFLGVQPTEYTFNNIKNNTINLFGKNYNTSQLIANYVLFERIFFFIILIFTMITLVSFNKCITDKMWIFIIVFAEYTFIHLIIEMQSRYMFFLFGFMAMFAAVFIINLESTLKTKLKRMQ